jgi:molybdopterin-guanine dinucleotide biosynthesis protein A
MDRFAGIVLAGGRSSRMGSPKAALDWHGQPLLERVVGVLRRAGADPVVVVRAPGQDLPPLGDRVEVVEDAHEGRGPLEGIAAGLRAVAGRAETAYVSSTDVPLLHPAFVQRVVAGLVEGVDVVVPEADGRMHPLAAAYRTGLLPLVEELLAGDRLRPSFLFDAARTRFVGDADLPGLDSLLNLNRPEDYDEARARPEPAVRVERFGTLRPPGGPAAVEVAAATLGAAAAAAGVELNGHVVAALNGDQIMRDPGVPLVPGDTLCFMSADAGG